MIWRLADLFQRKGRWTEELAEEKRAIPPPSPIIMTPPLKSNLQADEEVRS
jgi:hypothetical protein